MEGPVFRILLLLCSVGSCFGEHSYKCDCYVRLNQESEQAEWLCTATSDFECQGISLLSLNSIALTDAEKQNWINEIVKLTKSDTTESAIQDNKQCLCTVKIGLDDDRIHYYCNGGDCYTLAAELTSQQYLEGPEQDKLMSHYPRHHCVEQKDPMAPCCRCVNGRHVCSDSHCPVLTCPQDQQQFTLGHCCPTCQNHQHM